jgi:rhodanese-related sulfurtransferase
MRPPNALASLKSSLFPLIRPGIIILALSLVSALLANQFRSEPLSWDWRPGELINAQDDPGVVVFEDFLELERLLNDPAVTVVDARDERLYNIGHLPGAVSLPAELASLRAAPFLSGLPDQKSLILIYCSDAHCPLAERLALAFRELGRDNLKLFRPGFDAWLESGRAIER